MSSGPTESASATDAALSVAPSLFGFMHTLTSPLEQPEITRRLRACSLADQDVFVLLAADHRQNVLKQFDASLDAEQAAALLSALKVDFAQHLAGSATGYLTDPIYGLAPCIASPDVPATLPLIAALENTGYVGEGWERMSSLVEGFNASAALRMGATATKLLVYFHPDAENAAEKEEFVRKVAAECQAAGLPLFLEPLVYSPDPDSTLEKGTMAYEDAVVGTAERLSRSGPAIMKVEFPGGDTDNRDRWEAACERLDAACATPWVLLGAGVTSDVFLEQTAVACSAGASGVLVGRTIWGETIHLGPEERAEALRSAGVDRLNQLRKVIADKGHSWSERGGQV